MPFKIPASCSLFKPASTAFASPSALFSASLVPIVCSFPKSHNSLSDRVSDRRSSAARIYTHTLFNSANKKRRWSLLIGNSYQTRCLDFHLKGLSGCSIAVTVLRLYRRPGISSTVLNDPADTISQAFSELTRAISRIRSKRPINCLVLFATRSADIGQSLVSEAFEFLI